MYKLGVFLCAVLVAASLQPSYAQGDLEDLHRKPWGGGKGDPILTDFTGRVFQFFGQPYRFYNIYSDQVHQVNAGFIPGFIEGHNGTYMDRFEMASDKLRANITLHSEEGDIQVEAWEDGEEERSAMLPMLASAPAAKQTVRGARSSMSVSTEPWRPYTGRTVTIETETLSVGIWSVPAGTVDSLGVAQPAYLNFNITLQKSPVDNQAEGIIGESLSNMIRVVEDKAFAQSLKPYAEALLPFVGKGNESDYAVSANFGTDFRFNLFGAEREAVVSVARRSLLKTAGPADLHFPLTAFSK